MWVAFGYAFKTFPFHSYMSCNQWSSRLYICFVFILVKKYVQSTFVQRVIIIEKGVCHKIITILYPMFLHYWCIFCYNYEHVHCVMCVNNVINFSQGSGKVRKVKVLKEEPIKTKTKEKPQPGTLAYIAQRDSSKPGLRPDGPICGQCEIKAAVVVSL